MDNIDYMDRVLQVTQLSVCVIEFTANVFGKMPQMSSARIENGCESSIIPSLTVQMRGKPAIKRNPRI